MTAAEVHFFDELKVARQEMTIAATGEVIPMFGLQLSAWRQDKAGRHPPEELPTLWMEPSTAVALIQALYSALAAKFPEEVARVAAAAPSAAAQRKDN